MWDDFIARAAAEQAADEAAARDEAEQQRNRENMSSSAPGVTVSDFFAYMPAHQYLYIPIRDLWPAGSINARIPPIEVGTDKNGKPITVKPSVWLDQFKPIEQMTWAPGLPMVLHDQLVYEGGWLPHIGAKTFNLHRPPIIQPGDPAKAAPWVDHIKLIYPENADHILDFLAHRVQKPQEKINHALVLGAKQGIGKDTILEPVRYAVGPWNMKEVSPQQILGRFNGYLKSVILRVSEARDLGESDRFEFHDHMKTLTAAPPDTLRVDEKNLREYAVFNCCGVIITTNHSDGMYISPDDRRHYVAWSDLAKEDPRFQNGYWNRMYTYNHLEGGNEAVAGFLLQRDISGFDPKAPPPKTAAFWAIVDSFRPSEESELADVLDLMGNPNAFTLAMLIHTAEGQAAQDGAFNDWLRDRKNRRTIPHRLETCGYVPVRNPAAEDGLWKIKGKRQAVYANRTFPPADRIDAARKLTNAG